MTNLEKHIVECCKLQLPKIKERIPKLRFNTRYVEFIFLCDGIYDKIVWDNLIKKFTAIKYNYGIGNGIFIQEDCKFTALFDKAEIREIDLTNIDI